MTALPARRSELAGGRSAGSEFLPATGDHMAYWLVSAMFAGMALYYGVRTMLRARRPNRTPEQRFKMLESAWSMAGFGFGAALLAAALLTKGGPVSSATLTVIVVLAATLSVAGAFIHAWALRRLERLGPDADYGDLEDIPKAPSDDGPMRPAP